MHTHTHTHTHTNTHTTCAIFCLATPLIECNFCCTNATADRMRNKPSKYVERYIEIAKET